jgi:hypothetical protein
MILRAPAGGPGGGSLVASPEASDPPEARVDAPLWALKLRDPDFLSVFDLGDEVGSRFRPPGESIGMVEESRRRDWM